MKLARVFVSWDFWSAGVAAVLFWIWLPHWVPNDLAKDYYGIGISVLSVVFSIFFAALAVIISASDDDFVAFLEATNDYTAIMFTFKFSLGLLFCALAVSLAFYAYTAARISERIHDQGEYLLGVFSFLFLWSLFAALNSIFDTIKYSDYRRKFIQVRRKSAGS